MGKAFTDEEREQLRIKIQDVGLALFQEKGMKKVSIRDITSAVGIAQGGFYTFYPSKEALFVALIDRRIHEKLTAILENIPEKPEGKWADPRQFLSSFLYQQGMHLCENKAFDNAESNSLHYLLQYRLEKKESVFSRYHFFLQHLTDYWEKNDIHVTIDYDYLGDVLRTIIVMIANADMIGEHFLDIYRSFCEEQIDHVIR